MGKGESKKQYFHDNDQGHCIKRLKNVDYDGEWIEVFFKNMILKFHIFKNTFKPCFSHRNGIIRGAAGWRHHSDLVDTQ